MNKHSKKHFLQMESVVTIQSEAKVGNMMGFLRQTHILVMEIQKGTDTLENSLEDVCLFLGYHTLSM